MAEKVEQTFLVVTANRLEDGRVVYLRADRSWAPDLDAAELLTDTAERDARIAWAARDQSLIVTGCYGFDLGVAASGARVLSTREQIRAAGEASVRRRLGLER
jgi:hypothetical protein